MRISRILGSLALAASLTATAVAGTPPQQNKPTTAPKHVMAKHARKHVHRTHHAAKSTATEAK